ncbi:MAG: TetR family transcriptional regulator [Thermoleophilaceae bacterium]|nr:TetR family transcriptional regulator [Thermoleophilaceae bacterium]
MTGTDWYTDGRSTGKQARGEARRAALIAAAIEVISESGIAGVTHRAVASRADVPLASTSYYFASIDELIEEAVTAAVAGQVELLDNFADLIASSGGSADELAELIADALTQLPDSIAITQFDCYLAAARNPAMAPAAANAMDAFERLAAEALRVAGAREPDVGARAFVALADGFALRRLALPHDDESHARELRDSMRSLFIAYAMDDSERRTWSQRLREVRKGGESSPVADRI